MPHKSDSNYHGGATLSLSPPVCLSTRTLFPPNKHFTCFTTFHLYVEIHFYTADGPGACHWPLIPSGLVQGSPSPWARTGTGPQPVRNQATQQEVSGGQVSELSSAPPIAPYRWHYQLDHPSPAPIFHETGPWCQKGWGPLV